jgi:Domain of unknown function (DUF5130)
VPSGEAFTTQQNTDISRAISQARASSGMPYSVYVGSIDGDLREHALKLHASLPNSPESVLVAVDPDAHRLEIVTGHQAKLWLDDRACALAAMSMRTQFETGDIVGGICNGLATLAEHARHPRTLHTDQP